MRALFLLILLCAAAVAAPLKVASLHPLLSEMAQRIGGDEVQIIDLFPAGGGGLHSFAPKQEDIAAASGAQFVLACGMGLEPYLKDLRESLPKGTEVLELGKDIPRASMPGSDLPDPHWWNAPCNMKRASRLLLEAFSKKKPERHGAFASGQRAYASDMDHLDREARLSLQAIAPDNRILVTEHAAMCHFCKAYGFRPIALHGIAKESEGDVASLAQLLAALRRTRVRCLFAEAFESPRALQAIAREIPARVSTLILDGCTPEKRGYADIFRYNLRHIVQGLGTEE